MPKNRVPGVEIAQTSKGCCVQSKSTGGPGLFLRGIFDRLKSVLGEAAGERRKEEDDPRERLAQQNDRAEENAAMIWPRPKSDESIMADRNRTEGKVWLCVTCRPNVDFQSQAEIEEHLQEAHEIQYLAGVRRDYRAHGFGHSMTTAEMILCCGVKVIEFVMDARPAGQSVSRRRRAVGADEEALNLGHLNEEPDDGRY